MIETKLPSPPPSSSALGRPLDPRYLSNVVAAIGALATGIAFFLIAAVTDEPVAASPVGAAGAVFLAWAIAREIDPDRNQSAYLAMPIAFIASLFLAPSLLLGFGILVGTRLVSGTVGLRLKRFDLIALVGIGALMGLGWASLAGVVAIAAGTLVADGFSRRAGVTALLTTIVAVVTLWVRSVELVWESPGLAGVIMAAGLVLALAVSLPVPRPVATTDIGGLPLARRAVALSRTTLVGTIASALVIAGKVGFEAGLAVAGSALLGTAATAVGRRFRKRGVMEDPDGGHKRGDNRSHPNRAERMSPR
jgi:hypothetical protein